MTGELLLASVVVGLFAGWLIGVLVGKGGYGWPGDLSLGLVGSTIAVWIYQAAGLVVYAGMIGAMVAAFGGAAGILLAQRKLWFVRA
jgi:uncharacterized membrane protein YeaQ/YmgE (transglycosylase-associated protein family)